MQKTQAASNEEPGSQLLSNFVPKTGANGA